MALHKGVRAASTWALLARKFFDVLRENSFPIASLRGAVIYPRLSEQRVRGGRKDSIPCKKQLENQSIVCRCVTNFSFVAVSAPSRLSCLR